MAQQYTAARKQLSSSGPVLIRVALNNVVRRPEYQSMIDQNAPPEILTIAETATLLRISPNRTYELARQGVIPTVRLGRRIIVPRRLLNDWLDAAARIRA